MPEVTELQPKDLVVESGAPQDEIEAALVQIWAELTGVEQVTIHDNLLLLGGESLAATQISSRIRDRFNVDVSIRSVLIGTVAEVAMEIRPFCKGGDPAV